MGVKSLSYCRMKVYIICCNIVFVLLLHEANCQSPISSENDVKCNNSNGCESSCPPDSKIGSDGKCVCSYDKCPLSPANCNEGYVKKRVHESTEIPGECCSIDDCVKEIYKNCSAVTCPELEPCPSDSYRLPALTSVDGCCVMNQKCICLPTCHPKNCTADTTPVIEVQSTGEPGQCCPLYKCVKTVEDMTDEATTENSPQYCTDNGSGILNPNQILKHGANYTSAEKCSFCVCQNGDLTCSMPSCKPCIESVKLPNECCPRCTIPTEVGSHCPPMPNCTKPCPYGNELDANKCITCECKECPTECVYFDPSGIKQCDCNHSTSLSTSSQCPPLLDCNNHCEFGFKKDEKGCDVCKCTECHKQCSDGYMIDNKGVSICKCQPWLGISTKKPEAIENSVSCKTDMNVIRDDGETWFDGCRECTCISGKEMCSLVHCSPLTCSNPILNVTSSCCPFCADDPVKNKEMSHMVCSGLNGGLMLDGEIFILNECIQCVCREGRALCLSKECPPAPCSRPRQPNKGECCSTCSLSNEVEADFSTSFMSDDRCNQLHNSTVWRKDSCTSCRCVDSEARCFTELCESLSSCQRPLVIKGRCCPICIDEAEKYKLDDVCVHENTTYKSGNEWKLDSCRKCKCVSGHIECTEMVCPQVCMDTIHQPGKCCPVCADNPKFSFLQQISYTILLVVIIFISVMLVICLTKHWRYRKQQIHLRDFGCSPPQYHQYKVISSCPYDTTTSQKMLSSEKTSLAPV